VIDALRARLTAVDPPLAWTLRGYRRPWLRGDLLAGVTVAALIVPLSIGYAQVAGLPPEAGLYASLVPLIAYAVFGSARRLIVGPDAATAALVAAAIVPLASAPDERMRLAAALALLVALVFVAMRLATLGFLADFLSRPILVGYMTGVGLSVAFDQIPKILGASPLAELAAVLAGTDVTGVGGGAFIDAIGLALDRASVDLPSVVVGGGVFAAIMLGDRLLPGVPIALPSLVVALIVSTALQLPAGGLQVLGPVPPGLPPVALPLVSIDEALALLPGALGIAVLSFADTVLTGRSFAARHREETSPDRELVALSMADLGASLTSGYPISSSPSRTSAAEAAGSTTQLTGIIAAGAVAIVLLAFTAPLAGLPIPALGAVVLASAIRFIDLAGVRRIWRLERVEGGIAIAALVGVIVYGTLAGVGIAALLAAVNVFRRAALPRIDELGRLPGSTAFADLDRDATAQRVPGVLVVRYQGPLFFATANGFRARVRGLLVDRPDATTVVLDASGVVDLDLTAAEGLASLRQDLADRGISLIVARPTGALRDLLRRFGLGDLAGSGDDIRRDLAAVVGDGPTPPLDTVDPVSLEDVEVGLPDRRASDVPPSPTRHRWSIGVVLLGTLVVGVLAGTLWTGGDGSTPAGSVAAPNLVGLTYDRARTATESAGLVLGEPAVVVSTALPEGTVIDQQPDPGTILPAGSVIGPTITTRRGIITVPDVIGLPQADAIVALTTAGLRVGSSTTVPDATAPRGTVLATEPTAGREVAVDTEVRLTLSEGPIVAPTTQPTAVPTPSVAPPSRTPAPTATASPSPTASPSSSPSQSAAPSSTPAPTAAPPTPEPTPAP
jgi:SulP family sulfate permease